MPIGAYGHNVASTLEPKQKQGSAFCVPVQQCARVHQGVKDVSDALQEEVMPNEKYEHSEMLLYRAMVLDEGGKHTEALTHLDLCQVPCAFQNGNCYRDVCSKHDDSCGWRR